MNRVKSLSVFKLVFFIIQSMIWVVNSNAQTTIHFKSGDFEITSNITNKSVAKEIEASTLVENRYYFAIQFYEVPTTELKQQLSSNDIQLLDYIPDNCYMASVKKGFDFSTFSKFAIRSYFALKTAQKMDDFTFHGQFPQWAKGTKGKVDLVVTTFADFNSRYLSESITQIGGKLLLESKLFRTLTIQVDTNSILKVAALPWVQWIEPIAPKPTLENLPGKTLHRSNILNDGSRNLTGDGVKMGIWDGGVVGPHMDFTARLTPAETYVSSDHGTHVAGTMAGAGLIDPKARGMAPNALIYSYDYNGSVSAEVSSAISTYGINISQNSWGYGNSFVNCTVKDTYNSESRSQDIIVANTPTFLHVHSSGNSQAICAGGWGTTTGKAAKNILVVANVSAADAINSSSSFGPVQDGRIKPEISGLGVDVYSTLPNNTYTGGYTGTSMATPGVSGTAAQCMQLYRQLNANVTPKASLLKAILCNTAKDLGNAGPDFKFGFGRINGLLAAKTIEANRFLMNSVATGATNASVINVPVGVTRLKVMLCWTDPAAAANANPALVNNLNLSLVNPSAVSFLPWVLDPVNPGNNAVRATDNVNNIEQITIDNPVAGAYTISVNGFSVPIGASQEYALTWEIESPFIQVTYPIGGEKLTPGSSVTIFWDNAGITSNQTVQYSFDNGVNWINISTTVGATVNSLAWTVPAASFTNQALIRVFSGAYTDVSDNTFSVLGVPAGLSVAAACTGNSLAVSWSAVTNATHYDVLQLNNSTGVWTTVASNITTTSSNLSGLIAGTTYWLTVVAKNNTLGIFSERAIAKSGVPNAASFTAAITSASTTTFCSGDSVLIAASGMVPTSYQTSTITYTSYNPGTVTSVTLTDDDVSAALPVGFNFYFYGNLYTQFYISSNGFIGFDNTGMGAYEPQTLPSLTSPNNIIALAWTDLNPETGGTITYETTGTAPFRKLIVSYNSIRRYGSVNAISGRIVLNEFSNTIQIFSNSISSGISTMGIENATGTLGTAASGKNNVTWSIAANFAIQFSPINATLNWSPFASTSYIIAAKNTGNYSYSYTNVSCTVSSSVVNVNANPCSIAVTTKLFIQGFYSGSSTMTPVIYTAGLNSNPNATDSITVELHSANNPSVISATKKALLLNNGTATVNFPYALTGLNYYIVIRHRNSIETWSKSPVLLSGTSLMFDFTN